MTPDPKRSTKPYRAPADVWATIHEAFADELCWVCGERPKESLHHILARDGFGPWPRGDDVPANLAPVCGDGTRGCHGKLEARDPRARARLRSALMPRNLHYLTFKIGGVERTAAFLERQYPLLDGVAA